MELHIHFYFYFFYTSSACSLCDVREIRRKEEINKERNDLDEDGRLADGPPLMQGRKQLPIVI